MTPVAFFASYNKVTAAISLNCCETRLKNRLYTYTNFLALHFKLYEKKCYAQVESCYWWRMFDRKIQYCLKTMPKRTSFFLS